MILSKVCHVSYIYHHLCSMEMSNADFWMDNIQL